MLRKALNRLLQRLARGSPGAASLRPRLQRWRGVRIGSGVFIGDDFYIANEFPERVEIGDNAQISIRAIIIAHTRGPGRVIIEPDYFIGPNSVIICGGGRTLRIGRGTVVGAGSVVTESIPAGLYVGVPSPVSVVRFGIPLPKAMTMEEFWSSLVPIRRARSDDD